MPTRQKPTPTRDLCAEIREDAHARRCRRIREDLEQRGLPRTTAIRLAAPLEAALAEDDRPEVYDALLTGATLAQSALPRAASTAAVRGVLGSGNLGEIQRLVGGFATELRKLEETVEVLSAHLRRLQRRVPNQRPRILH